ITGVLTNVNSAIGTQPVEILSGDPRLTGLDKVLVAAHQNRYLEFPQTDFQPPVIVPGDMTVEAPDAVGPVAVTFPTIATDKRGVPDTSGAPASGSLFPIGPPSVTCTATDTAVPVPNTASKTFTVT